jgi:hypothetical protein
MTGPARQYGGGQVPAGGAGSPPQVTFGVSRSRWLRLAGAGTVPRLWAGRPPGPAGVADIRSGAPSGTRGRPAVTCGAAPVTCGTPAVTRGAGVEQRAVAQAGPTPLKSK